MDTETRTLIKDAYLYTFDAFAISPTDLVTAEIANNARHARELLAVLTEADLVAVTDVNGEDQAWQTVPTYDEVTREQAEATIDEFLAKYDTPTATPTKEKKMTSTATTTAKPAKAIEFKSCLCGCGENVPPKSNFRPGHDARMAGNLAKEWVTLGGIDDEMLQTLPTEALRDKAMAIYDRRMAKVQAKAQAKAVPDPQPQVEAPKAAAPKPTPRKRTARKTTAKA